MNKESLKEKLQGIKEDATELATTAIKVGIAAVPPLLVPEHAVAMALTSAYTAELFGSICSKTVPNPQKTMELEFSRRIANVEEHILREQMRKTEFEELYEQGVYEAARTSAQNKLKAIGSILACGVYPDANIAVLKRFLTVFSHLEELDLLLLLEIKKEDVSHKEKVDSYMAELEKRNLTIEQNAEILIQKAIEEGTIIDGVFTENYKAPMEKEMVSILKLSSIARAWRNEDANPDTVGVPDAYAEQSMQRLLNENLATKEKRRHYWCDFYQLSSFGYRFLQCIDLEPVT